MFSFCFFFFFKKFPLFIECKKNKTKQKTIVIEKKRKKKNSFYVHNEWSLSFYPDNEKMFFIS